jgi:hypothetical protein
MKNVLTPATMPSIAGTGAYNKALTLSLGKWNTGATTSYVWKRVGIVLDPQPSGMKYTPAADSDMGLRMSATVTVAKSGYYDMSIDVHSAVMNGKPIRPVLQIVDATGPDGAPAVGNTLSWSSVGSVPFGWGIVSQTWKVGTRVVSTGGQYVVLPADVGKKVSLTIKTSATNWASTTVPVTTPTVIAGGR